MKTRSKFQVIFLCVFFFFLAYNVFAESVEKPFLWKIQGQQSSYLFGTIHISDPRVTTLHSSVEKAFQESDYVFTEIPFDTKDMLSQVSQLMLEGEATLTDIVPSQLLQRTEKLLKNINSALTIAPFAKFKIWALATSLPLLEQQLNNPGALPMDAQLYQRAATIGIGTGGLETFLEQMQYFDNLTQAEELKMLSDTVEFMEQANAEGTRILEDFVKFYMQGDIDAFGQLFVEYVKQDEFSKDFMQKILHDRNVLIANRIAKKLKDNPSKAYFFAVGAGHFWGDTGIQHLLEKTGLKVIRMEK